MPTRRAFTLIELLVRHRNHRRIFGAMGTRAGGEVVQGIE